MANEAPKGPQMTERLWSDEVGLAEAGLPPVQNVAYRFSNGRTFAELKYSAPGPDAPPEWFA